MAGRIYTTCNESKSNDSNKFYFVKFEVLTVRSMKIAIFWNIALYRLVDSDRRFRAASIIITLMMEAVSASEMSVNIYRIHGENTRRQPFSNFILNIIK
jgi:hypothetical protein